MAYKLTVVHAADPTCSRCEKHIATEHVSLWKNESYFPTTHHKPEFLRRQRKLYNRHSGWHTEKSLRSSLIFVSCLCRSDNHHVNVLRPLVLPRLIVQVMPTYEQCNRIGLIVFSKIANWPMRLWRQCIRGRSSQIREVLVYEPLHQTTPVLCSSSVRQTHATNANLKQKEQKTIHLCEIRFKHVYEMKFHSTEYK